jgi:multidrug transporter EmrE-like cation transporter
MFGLAILILRYISWILISFGIGFAIDGIGSVLIKQGQYHTFWFDREREGRAIAGIILIIIGVLLIGP